MKDVIIKIHAAFLCCLLCAILVGCSDNDDKKAKAPEEDASQFVVLTDVVPDAIPEIRYYKSKGVASNIATPFVY